MECRKCKVRPYNDSLIAQQQTMDMPDRDRLMAAQARQYEAGYIVFCPLHAAAPKLLEALIEAREFLASLLDVTDTEAGDFLSNNGEDVEARLDAAIVKATAE